ncbi:DUF4395 domain-containing protein [Paenibacillus xylaniclasticus]|uniref:DUF4395 domain-containing protein n=1 Tax=Paenibacillus xylaniclasticus TaxID=588083 RepID=UPI000FD7FAE4|nr:MULTISPECIES: DUF4395 domain-containing protein [Paenibacillus]GFN33936.1 hypothetical protein PCURB6_41960 [Paenibacillus curdlanolyticus]
MTTQPVHSGVDDVPLHRVRGNQLGILLFIIISVVTQQLWLLIVPLVVQIISRTWGVRYNLFVRLFARIFPISQRTESRELLRFNSLLAILFLTGALIGFALGSSIVGYIFIGFLSIAVILALCGFCLGCFIYFQWKQFVARRRISG